jgi:hypothetical protein
VTNAARAAVAHTGTFLRDEHEFQEVATGGFDALKPCVLTQKGVLKLKSLRLSSIRPPESTLHWSCDLRPQMHSRTSTIHIERRA